MSAVKKRIKITVYACTCEQCGYAWQTLGPILPARCASEDCRSTRWNRPKAERKRGRPKQSH